MSILLRDYVIIGQHPDGEVVVFRYTVRAERRDIFTGFLEETALEAFWDRHPGATPVKGGSGWSQDYQLGHAGE